MFICFMLFSPYIFIVYSLIPTNVQFIISYSLLLVEGGRVHFLQANSEHVTADTVTIYPT
jgi:hypothetical protein